MAAFVAEVVLTFFYRRKKLIAIAKVVLAELTTSVPEWLQQFG